MKILGIEKLKCLNYIWRTFGVRNQLPCLMNQGASVYLRRCKTVFFKNWSIPSEYHKDMLCLFEGWTQYVSQLNKKAKEKALNRQTYLDILEDYLNSGNPLALKASRIVSGVVNKKNTSLTNIESNKKNAAAAEVEDEDEDVSSSSNSLSDFYVVVSNLTGKPLSPKIISDLGLNESHMLTDKPETFISNTWLSTDKMPIPWMFDGGSKSNKKNKGKSKSPTSLLPQLALVFGPPPPSSSSSMETDNPILTDGESREWKHLLDKSSTGWVAKNLTIPLFINPTDDLASFFSAVSASKDKQLQQLQQEKQQEQQDMPTVIVAAILALPPGGGKSTFMKLLQQKANAIIVSSDECTQNKKNFDKEIVRIINNSVTSKKNLYPSSTNIRIIGYDKNIPDEKGFEKLIKIIRPCQNDKINLKIAIIVPRDINEDQCWNRILKRDDTYLLTPALKPENEVHKIFNHFYQMTSSFLFKAQSLVSNQSCITECFFNDDHIKQKNKNKSNNNNDDEGGISKCGALLDALLKAEVPLFAQDINDLEEAFYAADTSTGGGGGGLGPNHGGKVNWCAADVIGTSLHMTLVPPPGSRSAEDDKGRFGIIKKLQAKTGQKLTLSASRYHLAEIKESNSKQDTRKRVGFWEVDEVDGLEDDEHYPSQRRCYHITDVGSLGLSTKPFASFEILDAAGGRGTIGRTQPSNTSDKNNKTNSKKSKGSTGGGGGGGVITKRGLDHSTDDDDDMTPFMKRAVQLATSAKNKGNLESGGVMVYNKQIIVEAEHSVKTFGGDVTATTECLLIRKLCQESSSSSLSVDKSKCIAYFNSEPDSLGIELLKRGNVSHVVYGVSDMKKNRSSYWQNSKINTEKFLLPIEEGKTHENKKSKPGNVASSAAAAEVVSPTPSTSSSPTSLEPCVAQVGSWTVQTFTLNPPLKVEAIVSMR
jgi:tRNA(Arg) A34 adenosine deaminase TadA/adenylate kinase family enzyme